MELIKWLENWYASNCDGDWEHCYGVKIETLDNPGWWVRIELSDTGLEDKPFSGINDTDNDDDWLVCRIDNGFFDGCGDPSKLGTIIEIFRKWAEE